MVGLPLEASGDEGPQATITRAWANAIAERARRYRITFRDERLTSHVAEGRLGPMKRGRSGGPPSRTQRDAHRARVDREAAAIILQDELDARAPRSRAARVTIRSGKRPRDSREWQARPFDPDAYATESYDGYGEPPRRNRSAVADRAAAGSSAC